MVEDGRIESGILIIALQASRMGKGALSRAHHLYRKKRWARKSPLPILRLI